MNQSSAGGGVSVVSLLTLLFLGLKLGGAIAWSWWWVFSPLWITGGVFILGLVAVVIYAVVSGD